MQDKETIKVWLNNTEPIVFIGDPNFQNPQEDILDKINNQQKLLSKIYKFNSVDKNWYYVTQYTYWWKPNYVHRVFEKTIRAERTKGTNETFNWVWWLWYAEVVPNFTLNTYATQASMVVNNWTFIIDRIWWYTIDFVVHFEVDNMAGVRMYIINWNTGEKYYLDWYHKNNANWLMVETKCSLHQRREIYVDSVPIELWPVIWYRGTNANWLPWTVKVLWDWWNPPVGHTSWGCTFSIKKEMEYWLFY